MTLQEIHKRDVGVITMPIPRVSVSQVDNPGFINERQNHRVATGEGIMSVEIENPAWETRGTMAAVNAALSYFRGKPDSSLASFCRFRLFR